MSLGGADQRNPRFNNVKQPSVEIGRFLRAVVLIVNWNRTTEISVHYILDICQIMTSYSQKSQVRRAYLRWCR